MRGLLILYCFYFLLLVNASESKEYPSVYEGLWLDWKGYTWQVKRSNHLKGPGPNYFGLSHHNVSVSKAGNLLLSIVRTDSLWSCAEIFSIDIFRNGLFLFEVEGAARDLHPQAVLGLFTYNESREFHYNESDVEISRWGNPNDLNAQFAHYTIDENPEIHRFDLSSTSNIHTLVILKRAGEVSFYYLDRKIPLKEPKISECKAFHRYSNLTHQPDSFRVHLNLWLFRGSEPVFTNKRNKMGVKVRNFRYLPLNQ